MDLNKEQVCPGSSQPDLSPDDSDEIHVPSPQQAAQALLFKDALRKAPPFLLSQLKKALQKFDAGRKVWKK
jgi:hypothetical protein